MLSQVLAVVGRAIRAALNAFLERKALVHARRDAMRVLAGAAVTTFGACASFGSAAPPPPPAPPLLPPPPPPAPSPALAPALGEPLLQTPLLLGAVRGVTLATGEEQLPDFGPLPQWSASRAFNRAARARFLTLARLNTPNLFDVGDRLAEVFSAAGYSDYGYYRVDGGFAMAARLEMINDDGTPARPARFISPRDPQPFGFAGFLGQLLFGEDGYYRVIVIVASNRAVTPQGGPPTVRRAEAWFTRAATALPSSYIYRPFTEDHNLTALIYEFRKSAGPEETAVVPVTRLTSQQHLDGAGVSRRLGLA